MNEVINRNQLRAWLVCLSAAIFFFYLVFQLAVFNTISADLMRDLGIHSSTLSQLASTYLYTCSIIFLPAGLMFDRFSTKTLLIIASLLCVEGTALIGITSSIAVAFLGRILVGISNPFSFLGPMRLVSRWFSQARAGLVIGLVVTIGMSGGIFAQSPFALLIHAVGGWRNAMLVNAACGLLITLSLLLFVKDKPENLISTESETQNSKGFLQGLKEAFIKKQNWLCGLYTGLIGTPVSVLGALWGNLYLVQSRGYSPIMAGSLSSLIFVGLIFGPLVFGWWSDKIGRRKLPITMGAIGVLFCILIIMYLNIPTYLLAMLLFLLGFLSGAQAINYPLVIESNPPEIESTSLGFISILVNLIGASSQLLLGWLISLHWNGALINGVPLYTTENFQFALAMLPIAFLLCIVLSMFMRETFNKRMGISQ